MQSAAGPFAAGSFYCANCVPAPTSITGRNKEAVAKVASIFAAAAPPKRASVEKISGGRR
jgi:hypothetical protein